MLVLLISEMLIHLNFWDIESGWADGLAAGQIK